MKKIFLTYLFVFFCTIVYSQEKRIVAKHINQKVKIDGVLDDSIWQNSNFVDDFVQFEPYNGQKPSCKTRVSLVYDNQAIYLVAECFVDNSKDIFSTFSNRDNFGQADYFGFYIDPYNTGITGYGFFVTASGGQVDLKIDNNTKNFDWDAVWFSNVKITNSSYIIEMKIPYSAFRFPQKDKQLWRINFYRNIQKFREIDVWNFVDIKKTGILNQLGYIDDIEGIKPPLRLSFTPHISSYLQKYTNSPELGKSYNGGLDLKYGINESFTIDMMLIPDFNQVEFDKEKLNLSPYETYYDEKRYFFTEGTEIFNKGDIFYSRRIGKEPTKYKQVNDMLSDDEVIINNPRQTQILNATKFSGKTNKGLGIGILNAFTGTTYAEILDTVTQSKRTILTEPFSNYNIMAINLPLKNNSYVSLTNTNYSSFGRKYTSWVTSEEAYIRNKKNSWSFFERFALSQIYNDTLDANKGFAYNMSVAKTSGNFRISINHSLFSDNYNPNDLGYLRQNNLVINSLSLRYNVYTPFWCFLSWKNSLVIVQKNLYDTLKYIGSEINLRSSLKFKNNMSIGTIINLVPNKVNDYFETRVDNKFYLRDPTQSFTFWYSSNYAKKIAYDFSANINFTKLKKDTKNGFYIKNSPRLRLSRKAFLVYSNLIQYDFNDYGYVGHNQNADTVFFGKRNIKYTINEINFEYNFTRNILAYIQLRHYWSMIDYFSFATLNNDGQLYTLRYSYKYLDKKDLNYNIFTVNFNFKWIFLPGSEFSVVYKQQIVSTSDDLLYKYFDNFEKMYLETPHLNSISFKLIYYIDYNIFRRKNNL